jgi:hypothetical protein
MRQTPCQDRVGPRFSMNGKRTGGGCAVAAPVAGSRLFSQRRDRLAIKLRDECHTECHTVFEIVGTIFRQTFFRLWFLWFLVVPDLHQAAEASVPHPQGLQQDHEPAEPWPAGGNSSYVIALVIVYLKILKDICLFVWSKPLIFLGMSFRFQIHFCFSVSHDLIEHVSSLTCHGYSARMIAEQFSSSDLFMLKSCIKMCVWRCGTHGV